MEKGAPEGGMTDKEEIPMEKKKEFRLAGKRVPSQNRHRKRGGGPGNPKLGRGEEGHQLGEKMTKKGSKGTRGGQIRILQVGARAKEATNGLTGGRGGRGRHTALGRTR